MKKTAVKESEASTLFSNLLLGAAVLAAAAPLLLGDQLLFIASGALTQGTLVLQDVSISLQKLLG